MKGVVVTTELDIYIQDFAYPLYKTVGEVVGGHIERVQPMLLERPYCMIVNEEGLLLDLPVSTAGCALYRSDIHGSPIVGNIVIMQLGYYNGEPDIVGLSDEAAEEIKARLERAAKAVKKSKGVCEE